VGWRAFAAGWSTVWPVSRNCTGWWPTTLRTRAMWRSASNSTAACSSVRWSRSATRSTVNLLAAARYRDPHAVSGAKSDRGDAKMLADLVRTDRHNHRRIVGDSELVEAAQVLARAHQSAIGSRQRQLNGLRSALRAYYPVPWRPSTPIWPAATPYRCCRLLRPRSWDGICRSPRSPRRCDAAAGNATSKRAPPSSRWRCDPSSSPPPPGSPTPIASWPAPPSR
jgi:hypothetical protein